MAALSRRAFLLATAFLRQLAGRDVSLDEFVHISQRMTGRRSLDRDVAATYLGALRAAPGNTPLLAEIAQKPASKLGDAHKTLEAQIVEWWYTGIYTIGGERRVATHTGALMWSALGMRAPGGCAGEFGAWARAPRT